MGSGNEDSVFPNFTTYYPISTLLSVEWGGIYLSVHNDGSGRGSKEADVTYFRLLLRHSISALGKPQKVQNRQYQDLAGINIIVRIKLFSLCRFQIQGYSKRSIHFQKFILQKTTDAKSMPYVRMKENLSKFWFESPARCARNNSVC
jgi:hypothetical protein